MSFRLVLRRADLPFRPVLRLDGGTSFDVVNASVLPVTLAIIGPKGDVGEGATSFEFVQSSPLTIWTVNHNLGRYPDVTVLSVGGAEVEASITSTSINQTIIQFTTPFAGRALMR